MMLLLKMNTNLHEPSLVQVRVEVIALWVKCWLLLAVDGVVLNNLNNSRVITVEQSLMCLKHAAQCNRSKSY